MSSPRFGSEETMALAGLVTTFVVTAAWWALALWPVADAPEWLARTRYVCFGVSESGLPDAGGWIGLIAGPAGMFGMVVIGWGRGVRAIIHNARSSALRAGALIFLVSGTAALIGGATLRVRQANAAETVNLAEPPVPTSTYPKLNKRAPALELVAHNSRELSLHELRGRTVLLTFAYAHCTTVCPVIVHDVLAAQQQLRRNGMNPVVLVVTLDPWRDTPSRLAGMARDWRFPAEDAWMLGGSVAQVESALAAWQVPYTRDQRNGAVTHPALVYIIDARGRIAYAATGGTAALVELTKRVYKN